MAGFRIDKKVRAEQDKGAEAGAVVRLPCSAAAAGGEVSQRGTQPRQEQGRSTVRLTFSVPQELHMRLKLAAVRQGQTIVSLVSGWIAEQTAAV